MDMDGKNADVVNVSGSLKIVCGVGRAYADVLINLGGGNGDGVGVVYDFVVPSFELMDDEVQKVKGILDRVVGVMAGCVGEGMVVAVACGGGWDGSALVVAYYLMKVAGHTAKDAVMKVEGCFAEKNKKCFSNRSFRKLLMDADC